MDQIHALIPNAGFRTLSVNKIHFSQNILDIIIKELNMKIQRSFVNDFKVYKII